MTISAHSHPIRQTRGLYGIAGPMSRGDATSRREEALRTARALIAAGVPILQLRDKWSTGRELLETARLLRRTTADAGVLFIVNDRADIALMSDADGVHVGQEDLSVEDVRRFVSSSQAGRSDQRPFLVGLSTHDLDQVRDGVRAGADYLGFGPIFETRTKDNPHAVRGTELLSDAVALASPVPVVAIGGICLDTAKAIARTGAAMAAVIGDIVNAPNPVDRAREIHSIMGGYAVEGDTGIGKGKSVMGGQ